jgi:hypothetical protein
MPYTNEVNTKLGAASRAIPTQKFVVGSDPAMPSDDSLACVMPGQKMDVGKHFNDG